MVWDRNVTFKNGPGHSQNVQNGDVKVWFGQVLCQNSRTKNWTSGLVLSIWQTLDQTIGSSRQESSSGSLTVQTKN